MLTFQELRIDGKYLIIDVIVNVDDYYENVEIDSIIIDTLETYSLGMPSSNPIYSYTVPELEYPKVYSLPENCNCNPVKDDDYSYCFVDEKDKVKRIRLRLDEKDLNKSLTGNLFFVYAISKGTPSISTPCGMDTYIKLGTVANLLPLYQAFMEYMRELSDTCDIPKGFVNSLLRYKALELNLKTGNHLKAIEYWNKFFTELKPFKTKGCGCGNN